MKILYVDYMSPRGHEVFNRIHIDTLLSLGAQVSIVTKGGFMNQYCTDRGLEIIKIPDSNKREKVTPLSVRVDYTKDLLWIKRNIDFSIYDYTIISSYEVISLFLARIKEKLIIIDHNNVDELNSSIKLFLTKHLPSYYTHIALNDYMMDRLLKLLPNLLVKYIPHGYLLASKIMQRPTMVGVDEKFIFCPVNRNYDVDLVNNIFNSKTFNDYLKKNRIFLYVKSQLIGESKGNIRVLGKLDNDEYNFMLCKSVAVLLPYGGDFKYRCSGILFECISRNTPVIATDKGALRIYEDDVNIKFFDDEESLKFAIRSACAPYEGSYNVEKYNPTEYWKRILYK